MTSDPELTPEDVGHAPATPVITEDERRAALRAGRTPVPTKFILLVVAAFVVLGLGGVVLERVVGTPGQSVSLNPAPATTPPTLPITPHSILGLKMLTARSAPGFSLFDQHGSTWSLRAQRGRVVILARATVNGARTPDSARSAYPVSSSQFLPPYEPHGTRFTTTLDRISDRDRLSRWS